MIVVDRYAYHLKRVAAAYLYFDYYGYVPMRTVYTVSACPKRVKWTAKMWLWNKQ